MKRPDKPANVCDLQSNRWHRHACGCDITLRSPGGRVVSAAGRTAVCGSVFLNVRIPDVMSRQIGTLMPICVHVMIVCYIYTPDIHNCF